MSILAKIFDKIFPWADNKSSTHETPQPGTAMPQAIPGIPPTIAAPEPSKPVYSQVDIDKTLSDLARESGQTLNWQTSIVDLLKLLGLDSSLESRIELAQELNYPGDIHDSAAMNIWLHKEVMARVAKNGGKVPAELKD